MVNRLKGREYSRATLMIVNIKLQSQKREITDEVYASLFNHLHESKIAINTFGDRYTRLRTQMVYMNGAILGGKIVSYTRIGEDNWFNEDKNDIENIDLDKALHPNAKETDYYFIPKAHRFCFLLKNGFSGKAVVKFLNEALPTVINADEDIVVDIEKDRDTVERILQSNKILKLNVNITYTNADLTEDFDKFVDEDLRNSGIGVLDLEARSTKANSIDLDNSKILKSAVNLSISNGTVEATIIEDGRRKVIKTEDHPRKDKIMLRKNFEYESIFEHIIEFFRRERKN